MIFTNPWLNGLVFGAIVVTLLMAVVAFITWFERKFAGRIQSRMGPTMVGPFGLLQPIADAVKAMQKESIIPRNADKFLYRLAPPLTIAFALGTAAVVPFAPGLLGSNLDIGVLYALAFSGLLAFPTWIAGWASNNKYALIGGMRMVAQGISYEIPMVMSALVPVVLAGTLSMGGIVEYQVAHGWVIATPVGFAAAIVFLTTALAEGNRIPFDIPEAESELVAGPTTEYNAIGWSIFAASEYAHSVVTSGIASALFLGGWDGWWGLPPGRPALALAGRSDFAVYLTPSGTMARLDLVTGQSTELDLPLGRPRAVGDDRAVLMVTGDAAFGVERERAWRFDGTLLAVMANELAGGRPELPQSQVVWLATSRAPGGDTSLTAWHVAQGRVVRLTDALRFELPFNAPYTAAGDCSAPGSLRVSGPPSASRDEAATLLHFTEETAGSTVRVYVLPVDLSAPPRLFLEVDRAQCAPPLASPSGARLWLPRRTVNGHTAAVFGAW